MEGIIFFVKGCLFLAMAIAYIVFALIVTNNIEVSGQIFTDLFKKEV